MIRRARFLAVGVLVLGCGGSVAPTSDGTGSSSSGSGSSSGAASSSGNTSSSTSGAPTPTPPPDTGNSTSGAPNAGTCCQPDPTPSCCMAYGGFSISGACGKTCDYMPSPDTPGWHIGKDAYGCPLWIEPPPGQISSRCGQPDAGAVPDTGTITDGSSSGGDR